MKVLATGQAEITREGSRATNEGLEVEGIKLLDCVHVTIQLPRAF